MEKLRNVARFGKYGKCLCMMFLFLCITTSGLMRASVFAQTTVTAKFRNVTLNEVLWEIQKQTDFTFIYSTNDAKKVRVENLDVKNETEGLVPDSTFFCLDTEQDIFVGAVNIRLRSLFAALEERKEDHKD